ncbi:MAG: DUF4132 domain-containing protein [Oceanospirillaceae bacterium]
MIEVDEIRTLFRRKEFYTIQQLIEKQPDIINHVFDGSPHEFNLLTLAVNKNNVSLVDLLIEKGARPLPESDLISNWLASGDYKKAPDIDVLKALLKQGATFPVSDENRCRMFIGYIMKDIYSYDYIGALKGMIKLGFDPVAVEKVARASMIIQALNRHYEKDSKIADHLIMLGCSVNALSSDGYSPIGQALEKRSYAFVAKLLDLGADISIIKKIAYTLVKHPNMPAELRSRMAEGQELSVVDDYGVAPIHAAAQDNNREYISFLVTKGVDINFPAPHGSPLMYAITSNCKESIKLLIDLGADVNTVNKKKETALDIAQTVPGFKCVCTMLIKAGAKTSIELSGSGNNKPEIIASIERSIQGGEVWASKAKESLSELNIDQALLWNTLIRHCLDNSVAKPSNKWMKEAEELVESIGEKILRENLLSWLPLLKEKRIKTGTSDYDYESGYYDHEISESNTRLLKALIWLASRFDDADMSRTLRTVATHMYKKVSGIGMRNAKLGNAAIYSLSIMPGTVGLKEIIVLRAATKYNPALVNINRVFDKLAEASGKTSDELAELATPDYGLTALGEFRQTLGDFEAIMSVLSSGKCELVWQGKTKIQKSVPAAIKGSHAEEIKAIKALIKDVQTGCAAHSQRIESMYLGRKQLDYATWKEQYVDHRLIGFLARRLIWRVKGKKSSVNVIYSDNGFISHDLTTVDIDKDAIIHLWHPSMSTPQNVLAWRHFLINQEITQPFKQAHREIYLLTDAERTTKDYSLRFASHILKHSQFHALASQRGWDQQRGGYWDGGSENSAYKSIPAFNTSVSFEAEGAESYGFSDTGIYDCVATGRVCFSKRNTIDLEKVDALLFSEVMRDIDLFVGVTSIGNDPNWRDRDNEYWSSSSFGDLTETAKTRKDVLTALIPKLKIADQLKLEGKFLIVEGKLITYKIHLGSSNILMAPNDSYLCIVEVRSKSKVMLPFEGDHTLSLILSKAMMLANDDKIKDATILSQIRGNTI